MQKDLKIIPKLTPSIFAFFVSKGKWKYTAHLKSIEKEIFNLLRRKNKILIVNMPPRHGKSEFLSKYFPLWYLMNFPDNRIILTSYQAGIAEVWSRHIREKVTAFGPLFGVSLDPANKKSGEFSIRDHAGGLTAVGFGGALTGRGADLLIVDDPVKNDSEANSQNIRDKIWDWFNSTAFTRLEPDGVCIVVMTRWHEDDLCGRLLTSFPNDSKLSNQIKLLSLAAIAESDDLLGREQGEALWEERFPLPELERIRNSIGNYWFSALYLQNPVPAGNSIFRRENFRYFRESGEHYDLTSSAGSLRKLLKSDTSVFVTVDLAISARETSDYTAAIVFAKTKSGDILILDIIREKFESTEHLKLLESINSKYSPTLIGIENVQYQQSLIGMAIRAGLPVKPLRADKDKISRALPMAALLENGRVFFRSYSDYLEEFERELLAFPKSKHDDQVDAFAYIHQLLSAGSSILPI